MNCLPIHFPKQLILPVSLGRHPEFRQGKAQAALVKRFGIYQVNRIGMLFSSVFGLIFIVVGYMGNFPLMLIVMALRGLGMSPMLGI